MNTKGRTINSIKGEIHNLLAILRFLPSSCPEVYTEELLDLFQKLLVCSDVDGVDFWSPFLKIIQGPDSSSAIKGVALSSIHKFLLYGFLSPKSAYTLNKIVNGVVQCIIDNFSSSDEVVLMKLLHVFLECLRAPASIYLTDASVWSISKRCFDMYERERASELLKKTAQNTLLQIFLIVFGRVVELTNEHENSSYGVLCLKKIILHLAHLIGFSDKTDSNFKEKRCLGLFLMNTALETAGENIGLHKDLISVIQDEVCKSLLINSATDDLFILTLTLRVVFNLFQSVKQHLKVQQEVFFNSLHLKIAAAYDETGDPMVFQRSELALESIVDFCREPSLILELYTNYDCDVDFANIFERLAKFLCKHAFPLNGTLNRLNELCIEGLLAIITSISMRCDPNLKPSENILEDLKEKKTLKEIYLKSAEIFNSDPKEFIPKLQELNYLAYDCDTKGVAKFFKENPAIDHVKLGEYLGSSHEFNKMVLQVINI